MLCDLYDARTDGAAVLRIMFIIISISAQRMSSKYPGRFSANSLISLSISPLISPVSSWNTELTHSLIPQSNRIR